MRYGVFVHEPDGDMGYGQIIGAFKSAEAAQAKADAVDRASGGMHSYLECIVVALVPGSTGAKDVVRAVTG